MQHSLNTVASASTIPQICVWPPAAAARVHNRFFCNLLHFVEILLHFVASLPVQRRSFMHFINLTQSQIRICVFYSHVTCCLCNFVVFCGQLHSDSGESDFLHFFCSALAIITKSHLWVSFACGWDSFAILFCWDQVFYISFRYCSLIWPQTLKLDSCKCERV